MPRGLGSSCFFVVALYLGAGIVRFFDLFVFAVALTVGLGISAQVLLVSSACLFCRGPCWRPRGLGAGCVPLFALFFVWWPWHALAVGLSFVGPSLLRWLLL